MFKTRNGAAQYLTGVLGHEVTAQSLADRAHDGTGPAYAIINGRALYKVEDLDAWVAEQAARPVLRRTRRAAHAA